MAKFIYKPRRQKRTFRRKSEVRADPTKPTRYPNSAQTSTRKIQTCTQDRYPTTRTDPMAKFIFLSLPKWRNSLFLSVSLEILTFLRYAVTLHVDLGHWTNTGHIRQPPRSCLTRAWVGDWLRSNHGLVWEGACVCAGMLWVQSALLASYGIVRRSFEI